VGRDRFTYDYERRRDSHGAVSGEPEPTWALWLAGALFVVMVFAFGMFLIVLANHS